METNVFQKLETALNNGESVTLSRADIWLLMEIAGDEIALAKDKWDATQELYEDYQRQLGWETETKQ